MNQFPQVPVADNSGANGEYFRHEIIGLLRVAMKEDDMANFELLQSEFWPGKSIHKLLGWTVNEDSGVTWRANCVFPYGAVTLDQVESLIDEVIRFYNGSGHPAAFKITNACQPPDLDERLERRGFEKRMLTHVQTLDLGIDRFTLEPTSSPEIHPNVTEEWLDKQKVDKRYQGQGLKVLEGILRRIPGEKGFAIVRSEEKVVAVGLGVVHKDWLALFSIRVDSDKRRKGIGRTVSKALLNWGMELGARKAFLQVEVENIPAQALYRELGFETVYTYWYRILPYGQR